MQYDHPFIKERNTPADPAPSRPVFNPLDLVFFVLGPALVAFNWDPRYWTGKAGLALGLALICLGILKEYRQR